MWNEIIGLILYSDDNLGVKIPWPENCRAMQTESKVNICCINGRIGDIYPGAQKYSMSGPLLYPIETEMNCVISGGSRNGRQL